MYSLQLYLLSALFGLFLNLGTDPSNAPRPAWCAPTPNHPLLSFLTMADPGCNAACQYNKAHPPKPHPPGTISFTDWAPSTETCSGNVCSSNDNSVPLIQLDGAQFGPNTYAEFEVYSRASGAQLFSALAPVDNLGYTGIQTHLRDCSQVLPDAAMNNAYAKAYDSQASDWGKKLIWHRMYRSGFVVGDALRICLVVAWQEAEGTI